MGDIENENNVEPFVSVIIPFYNVEKYTKYCMESLVRQDYKNCEFICIDDGSTDGTLEILKKFTYDKRVNIVHKENGGLSDARNYGILAAKGDYISFIDGDDFVHPQYLSHLVNAVKSRNNRIAISPFRRVKYQDPMDIDSEWADAVSYYSLSKKDVFEKILYDELSVSACGKLVPRWVYNDLKFPIGMVSEEVATIGNMLCLFSEFSIIDQPLYGYVIRSESIGHKKAIPFKDIQDRIDSLTTLEQVINKEFDINRDCAIKDALQYRWGWRYVTMATMYNTVTDNKHAAQITKENAIKWLKKNIKSILHNKRASLAQRCRILLYTFFPGIYLALYHLYQKWKYNF